MIDVKHFSKYPNQNDIKQLSGVFMPDSFYFIESDQLESSLQRWKGEQRILHSRLREKLQNDKPQQVTIAIDSISFNIVPTIYEPSC